MFALFAGVKVEPALRALPDRIGEILQQCATFRTAGDGSCSGHVHRPRPECVFSFRRRRLLELFFRPATGILVSALPVFAVGQEVPPAERSFSAFGSPGTRGSLMRPPELVGGEPGVPARPRPRWTLRLRSGQAREGARRSPQASERRELSFTYQGATIPIDRQRN